MDYDHLSNLFAYNSTCAGRRIRLCRLRPGVGTEQLRLTLVEVDLDDQESSFAAISYVWGDPDDRKLARCDCKVIHITRSLYGALWQLRQKGYQGLIWADAICIDQTNLTEKTEQIRMMGDIYERAEQHICSSLEQAPQSYTDCVTPDLSSLGIGADNVPQEYWLAMVAILQRPWFWRAWVVQEYHRARKCVFQCGNLEVDPNLLFGVFQRIGNHQCLKYVVQMIGGSGQESVLGPFFEFWEKEPGKISLTGLLSRSRGLRSSERKDRLFALVGLSSDTSSEVIDYNKDFDEVLRQITKQKFQELLNSRNQSALFKYLCLIHDKESIEGHTSWAPSFELPMPFRGLGAIFDMKSPLKSEPQVTFIDLKLLHVKGRMFDRVQRIIYDELYSTPAMQVTRRDALKAAKQTRKVLVSVSEIDKLIQSIPNYPTGESTTEVFWRSLIFDTQDEHTRASPAMAESFQSYRESFALIALWLEHKAGKYSDTSAEEILEELQELAPNLRWRPSIATMASGKANEIWAEIREHVNVKSESCSRWSKAASLFTWGRMYFISKLGYVGWVPSHAQEGDLICSFYGSRFPFIVRPHSGNSFRLIGSCYMHGIMEGEALELPSTDVEGDRIISLL